MKFIQFIVIAALLAGVGYAGIGKFREETYLAAVHPVVGPATLAVYATGTVEPVVMLPVAPRTSGRLTAFFADEGQRVKKDEILAQIEDDDIRNVLAEAQAGAELAQKERQRKQELLKRGVVSVQAIDQVEADWKSARAKVEQAQAALKYMKLISPAEGSIIRRDGEIGQVIAANQPVFWLSCCAGLRVSAEVDEEDIALVQPGQKVILRADAFPDQVFIGDVQSITPKGDPVARSYRVRISIDPKSPLMIGMTAEANIIISEKQGALLAPTSAVADGKVWVDAGGKLESRPVKTGIRGKDAVEITDGLTQADLIVKDAYAVPEGGKVTTRTEAWEVPPQ